MAKCRGEAGDPAAAVALLEPLVDEMVTATGPDHLRTLIAKRDLARWRGESGDAAGAALAFEQLLTTRLRVLDPDHPRL